MEIYRGDIFYVEDRFATQGSEQRPGRPAVVVSNNLGNKHSGNVSIVWLTTSTKKDLPTHCEVICNVPSTAICEQVVTLSKDRLGDFIRTCTSEEMESIDRCLMVALSLETYECGDSYEEGAIELVNELKEKLNEKQGLLEAAEKQITDAHEYIEMLQAEKAGDEQDVIRLATERDLYKRLYEQTFERLIG